MQCWHLILLVACCRCDVIARTARSHWRYWAVMQTTVVEVRYGTKGRVINIAWPQRSLWSITYLFFANNDILFTIPLRCVKMSASSLGNLYYWIKYCQKGTRILNYTTLILLRHEMSRFILQSWIVYCFVEYYIYWL